MTRLAKALTLLAALAHFGCGPSNVYAVPAEQAAKMNDKDWKITRAPAPATEPSPEAPASPPAPPPAPVAASAPAAPPSAPAASAAAPAAPVTPTR